MKLLSKSHAVAAACLTSALVVGGATSASAAPIGFYGYSTTEKAWISGTYQYWKTGTGAGRAFYDGKFTGVTAKDRAAGDGYEAVMALDYDEFVGGGWRHVKKKVVVVNSTKSWTFKAKANVKGFACDRRVGAAKPINCKEWRH